MPQDEGKYAVPLLLVLLLIAERNKNKRATKSTIKFAGDLLLSVTTTLMRSIKRAERFSQTDRTELINLGRLGYVVIGIWIFCLFQILILRRII